jgi:hypothetical protein
MLNVCTMAQLVYFEQGAVYTLQPRDVMLYADQGARDVFLYAGICMQVKEHVMSIVCRFLYAGQRARDVFLYAGQGAPICRPGGQGVATAPRHLVYANWYVPLM